MATHNDPKVFLAQKCSEGVFVDEYSKLLQLYEKRLWHELTQELLVFMKNDHFKQNGGLKDLYENFLSDFEHRINQLSFAELILLVGQEITDHEEAIQLFKKTTEKVKHNVEANILCLTAIGRIHLARQQLDETKTFIKDAQALLDSLDGVTTVHGRFYDLASNYHQTMGSYNDYYRDALRFLGCMDLKEIPDAELKVRAFSLSLAALLGSEVYNFGELLSHEVLAVLQTEENKWLVDLLFAFNSGDIDKFNALKPFWSQQADLARNELALLQKITLLSLMEMSFKQSAHDRSFSFQNISEHTHLPLDEVEHLVMKALSLGLVKGTIDEVDKTVHITWVQPRVLDKSQIKSISDLLGLWSEKVKSSISMVEGQVPELLVK